MDSAWIDAVLASPFLLPALFGLVVIDAFLVVIPSETLVVAIGAVAMSTGSPIVFAALPVAAAGAIVGDTLCFFIGRRLDLGRVIRRGGRIGRAVARVERTVAERPAVLIFTARYIPFARIAVNLAAGASALPYRRYLPLSAAAGVGWALYNVGIGALAGAALRDQPLLAVAISVPIAITVGLIIDAIVRRSARSSSPAATGDEAPSPEPISRARTSRPRG